MRIFATIAYGFATSLVLLAVAATLIGAPRSEAAPRGGLTAATILGSDTVPPAERPNAPPPSS